MTWAQIASVETYKGVIVEKAENPLVTAPLLWLMLTGIKTAHPIMVRARKISRHMFVKRKKTVASIPIRSAMSCSFVCRTG